MKKNHALFNAHILCAMLICAAGLSGCVLTAQSPDTQCYTLASPPYKTEQQMLLDGPRIAIGPITLPGYLNHPSLFVRQNSMPSKVTFANAAQWSEPLDDACLRVLSESVEKALRDRRAVVFSYRTALPADRRIFINTSRFDGAPESDTVLEATWSILTSKGTVLRSGHFSATEKAGNGLEGLVSAQSKLLHLFGAELAKEIRKELDQSQH